MPKASPIGLAFLLLYKIVNMFTLLSKLNKLLLPSFTKKQLDLSKAKKWQVAIIGWRYCVTKRALDESK
jgi:hypothetical protein